MKGKLVNPNNISDMDVMNAKSQASMAALLQKIGKGKRKKEVTLSKNSQKYLEQMIGEMKKQMIMYEKQLPNVFSFFNYVEKSLHISKKEKRPKEKVLALSFEEYDLIIKQMKDVIKGLALEKSKLKWYNIVKKMVYRMMTKQTEELLKDMK
ncbi:viral A-type inclusion protein [Streptobacillus ratti]|uniref:viral A-type inclusion protein n=1 Tax=Streptobacillus ratti TaxID=1720557 RepID=UPI000932107E|nr:viral A-type inclusion protein [Streptobacillus ratti]